MSNPSTRDWDRRRGDHRLPAWVDCAYQELAALDEALRYASARSANRARWEQTRSRILRDLARWEQEQAA